MGTDANPVGWFEIPVKDMSRAIGFYEYIFQIHLEEHQLGSVKMAWFPLAADELGSPGSLVQSDGYTPSLDGVLIYFTAPDINAVLGRIREKNGHVITPKTSIGEYGFMALIEDSEGNRIGLHSRV